jgi:predicted RNase H-like nuclease (RuvC/YqgF family)
MEGWMNIELLPKLKAKRGKKTDEVTITEKMTQAGADACVGEPTLHGAVSVSYRAMRALDPEIKAPRRELETTRAQRDELCHTLRTCDMVNKRDQSAEREEIEELRARLMEEREAIAAWRAELQAAVAATRSPPRVREPIIANPFREFPTDRRRMGGWGAW